MVEYLEINGEKHPVRVGYYVMKTVQEETGKSLMEALESADEDVTVHEIILWSALKMGKYIEEKSMDIPFEREEMPMVLDQVYYKYLDLFQSEKFFPPEVKEKAELQAKAKAKAVKKNGEQSSGELTRGKKKAGKK